MSNIVPSYLTQSRHGIWYFQLWIPKRVQRRIGSNKTLYRRSLRTRNKKKALQLARQWWVLMDSDNSFFEKKYPNLLEAEREMEREEELYFLGKKISEEFKDSGIDGNNSFEIDRFFEMRPPSHLTAFAFYEDHIANLEQSLTQNNEQGEKQNPASPDAIAQAMVEYQRNQYSDSENPTLDILFLLWEKDKKSSMAKSSFAEYGRETLFFGRVVTEFNNDKSPRIADLNVSMIRHYREVFSTIPKSVKTADKTIEQLISMKGVKKNKSTIKDTFQKVGGFIIWATKKGYPVQTNIHAVLTTFEQIKADQKKRRVPFDDNDLKKLFMSDSYRKGNFKRASEYWAPLIALYSGGTLSEIIQLHTEDLYKDKSGYWVMDINDNGEKQLKNKDGRPRIVPIHPTLKNLGFIDFINFQRKRKNIRLFPCEKRNTVGKFGAFSNRFRNYRDKVGAGPRNEREFRDFHSFRHLVRTKLTELGKVGKASERFNEGLIDDIVGHTSSERSMGKRVYTHTDLVKAKYNALKRLEYELDLSKIARWDNCVFYRKKI